MDNYTKVSSSKVIILSLFILAHLSFSGCTYVGRAVPVDNRIEFGGDMQHRGLFSYGSLAVDYGFLLDGDNMDIAGTIDFHDSFDSLNVFLLFVDTGGRVLQQRIIYSSGYRASRYDRAGGQFQETLFVPPGAAAISFNYSHEPRKSQR